MLRRTLRLWRRACSAGGAIFALHSGQPGRLGDRLAHSRYASQYINTALAQLALSGCCGSLAFLLAGQLLHRRRAAAGGSAKGSGRSPLGKALLVPHAARFAKPKALGASGGKLKSAEEPGAAFSGRARATQSSAQACLAHRGHPKQWLALSAGLRLGSPLR